MRVGYDLYRMLRAGMPATWSQGERLVALIIADSCNDRTREGRIPLEQLCDETGYTPKSLSDVLGRLSRHGYEMRIPHGTGKDGRPVFATRGHATDFRVPILKPRPTPGLTRPERPGPDRTFTEKGPALTDKAPVYTDESPGPDRTPTPVHPTNPNNQQAPVVTTSVEGVSLNGHGGAPRQPHFDYFQRAEA